MAAPHPPFNGVPFLILPNETIRWNGQNPNTISALQTLFHYRDYPFRPDVVAGFTLATAVQPQNALVYPEGPAVPQHIVPVNTLHGNTIVPVVRPPIPVSGIPLRQAPFSTRERSRTRTSSTVKTLVDTNDRLIHVYRAWELWDRMAAYALGHYDVTTGAPHPQVTRQRPMQALNIQPADFLRWPTQQDIQNESLNQQLPPPPSAWSPTSPADSLPPLLTQLKLAAFLKSWYEAHLKKPSTITINSEPAVQDQCVSQFLEPINTIMKVSIFS